jgi:cytochrome b
LSVAPGPRRIRIWDLPTRLFHWAIVLLIPALWWTHQIDRLDLHLILGEIMLGLILFRIFWGLFGSSTARFLGFVRGPAAVLRYLRGKGEAAPGHNPIGGWNVMVMLLLIATEIGLGLFVSDEDGLNEGPLAHLISYDSARILAHRHETLFYILLGFIALHIAAILFYAIVKRDNLVVPLVTGSRPGEGEGMRPAPLWRFLAAAGLAVALTLWIALIL